MKSLILRSFCITAIALLIIQDADAQRGRNYRYNRGYGYGPYRGQRVVHIAGPRIIVPYRGISFHYSNGYYYRPYGGYFRVVAPPIGININYTSPWLQAGVCWWRSLLLLWWCILSSFSKAQ